MNSTLAPMLGAVSTGSVAGANSYTRQDRQNRTLNTQPPGKVAERRALKRAERLEVAGEIDEILAGPTVDEDLVVLVLAMLDDEGALTGWHEDMLSVEAVGADPVACYCRRCYLHDDPGGCVYTDTRPLTHSDARSEVLAAYYAPAADELLMLHRTGALDGAFA